MNSCLRHRAMFGAGPGQFELGQEVGSVVDVDLAFSLRRVQQAKHAEDIRRFHVPEVRGDMDDSVLGIAESIDFRPLGVGYAGHRQRVDRHDDHVFMQHVVVFDSWPASPGAWSLFRG